MAGNSSPRIVKRRLTPRDGVAENANRTAMVLEQEEDDAPDMVIEEVHDLPGDETDPMADENGDHRTGTEDQHVPNDRTAAGGVGQPMQAQPTFTRPAKGTPPPDSYVISYDDDGNTVGIDKSWFEVDESNGDVVYAKQDIVKKVIPPNTITPTYVLVAPKGQQLTTQAAENLGK